MNRVYLAPPTWDEFPVVVVAGGPSLSLRQIRHIGIARSKGLCRVIAVGDSVYPCWFADIAYSSDAKWWERHGGLPRFRQLRISLEPTHFPNVWHLINSGIQGYDERPGHMRSGGNSAYQSTHLAAQRGGRTILLVGVDYNGDARQHWFGLHPEGMDRVSNTNRWRDNLRGLTDVLADLGVRVINCSPGSTITWLPTGDVESFFEEQAALAA